MPSSFLTEHPRLGRGLQIGRFAVPLAALAATWLVVRHFAKTGWPFTGADWRLVCAAGVAVGVSELLGALAWQRLFPDAERPSLGAVLTAVTAGAASSHVLPAQLNLAVKVGLVHRLTRGLKLKTVAVTLSALGVLNVAAMLPLALAAALVASFQGMQLVALAVVAASTAALLLAFSAEWTVGRLGRSRLRRLSAAASVVCTSVSFREKRRPVVALLFATWVVRTLVPLALLASFGVHAAASRALLLVALGPIAGVIPSPSGTTTSIGATAAILSATGLGGPVIFGYALAASVLSLFAALTGLTVGAACLVCSPSSDGAARRARLKLLVLAPLGAFRA